MYFEPTTHLRHRAEETERLLTERGRREGFRSPRSGGILGMWRGVRSTIDARKETAQLLRALRAAEPRVRADLLVAAGRR